MKENTNTNTNMNTTNTKPDNIRFIGTVTSEFKEFYQRLLKSDSNCSYIQLGDFMIGDSGAEKAMKELNILLRKKNSTLYIVRGDRDCIFVFKKAKTHSLSNIKLVKDGSLLEIEGKSIFFSGGGIYNYQCLECPEDLKSTELRGVQFLEVKKADIFVSHTAPVTNPFVTYPEGFHMHHDVTLLNEFDSARKRISHQFDKSEATLAVSAHYDADFTMTDADERTIKGLAPLQIW